MFSHRPLTILSSLLLLGILLLISVAFFINLYLQNPLAIEKEEMLIVAPGDTLSKISYELADKKWLKYPKLLIVYVRLLKQTHLAVGEYRIEPGINPRSLLKKLESGGVVSYRVTLVEGRTFRDYLNTLTSQDELVNDLVSQDFEDITRQLNLDIAYPEGWFYPDTYHHVRGTTHSEILLQSHQRMRRVLNEEWKSRQENLPYKNAYEALVMASIVEKETGTANERGKIAGVFVRRLQKGMRLQTDPTVIYGLGDDYKGNIRRKHLQQFTPYNTYLISGLPPTPIAMPG
ncbi:MAG: UPF0755 protein, partial [Cellvibrionaceae bacterium]